MRRVLAFLEWRSDNWLWKADTKTTSSLTTCPLQLEGLYAYASRQAQIFDILRQHFSRIWSGLELPRKHLNEHAPCVPLDSDLMELDGDDA